MLIVILLSCLFVLPFHPRHPQFQYTHPNLNEDILSDSAFDWLVSFLQQLFRSRCHHGGAFIWNNVKSPQVRRPKQSATFSRHKTSRNDAMVVSLTSPVAAVYSPMHLSGGAITESGGTFDRKPTNSPQNPSTAAIDKIISIRQSQKQRKDKTLAILSRSYNYRWSR